MKPLWICLGLALASIGAAAHAQANYSGDPLIKRAQTQARTASFLCEKELNAGAKSAPSCERFHASVLQSMTLEARRLQWCQAQFSSEASGIRVPDSCLGHGGVDTRIDAVERLERQRSPASWLKFDRAMAKLP
jgi:hypothetical protein